MTPEERNQAADKIIAFMAFREGEIREDQITALKAEIVSDLEANDWSMERVDRSNDDASTGDLKENFPKTHVMVSKILMENFYGIVLPEGNDPNRTLSAIKR